MDQYFNANAMLSILYGKLACLAKGLGQDGFDTLVVLAEKANSIMEVRHCDVDH